MNEVIEEPCPVCGAETEWQPACPGYGDPLMRCNPPCGNADFYHCFNRECDWWYRFPDRRPESTSMPMGARPEWYTDWRNVVD